jgi:AmmeMemoRadiSam system protein B
MKSRLKVIISINIIILILISCNGSMHREKAGQTVRPLKDTIGFAQYMWQMDSLMSRMTRRGWMRTEGEPWKLAICPHDDYTYVGELYPELLQHVKARNLILIGVAHRAAAMGIEDSLVFDSFSEWKGPWKNIPVSPAREEILNLLGGRCGMVNDSLHRIEHSIEAMIPFLQYFNRDITFVPILVPAMSTDRMEACGKALAGAISIVAKKHDWILGKDYAIIVTTDAVHYGNEDWGGSDYAFFGCDENGNTMACDHEHEIIDSCLIGELSPLKIRKFNSYTLQEENFRKYKWTWCGRYCIPVALYTSYYLSDGKLLSGELVGYSTSIKSDHVPVDDIRMGRTAIATPCHWVGYASIGYR